MPIRFDDPEQPPAPREPATPSDDPSLVAPAPIDPAVRMELDKLPDVEPGYVKYLDGGLSPAMEQRVEIQRDRIQATLPDSPSPHLVRLAWAETRTNEPQPENHKFANQLQHEFALAKNIAYARELDAARARQPEPEPAPAAPQDPPSPAAPAALAVAPNEPRVAAPQPTPQPPSSPQTPTPLQVRPLMMDELREKVRTIPEVQARVNLQIAALQKRPDMQTPEQRQEAFGRVQAEMTRAAHDGDKVSERKLRIQILALDELTRETVVAPRPLPAQTEDPTNPNRSMSAAPARFNVSDSPPGPVIATVQAPVVPTVAGPRPLPVNTLEPTDPNLSVSPPGQRFVVDDVQGMREYGTDAKAVAAQIGGVVGGAAGMAYLGPVGAKIGKDLGELVARDAADDLNREIRANNAPIIPLREKLPNDLNELEPAIERRIEELRTDLKTVGAVQAFMAELEVKREAHLAGNRARGAIDLHIEDAALARLKDEMERATPTPPHLKLVRTPPLEPDSSQEGPPIHRRSDLGLPPPPDLDGPTVTDPPAPDVIDPDAPTVRRPSAPGPLDKTAEDPLTPDRDDLQASDERSPPIHKLEDLIPREPAPLAQDVPDDPPTLAVSEPATAPGRRGANVGVKAERIDVTQEVGQDDLIIDELRPVGDTQAHFSRYFDQTITNRSLMYAMRDDAARYQDTFNKALAGHEERAALLGEVTNRIASFSRGDGNAHPDELARQYQILVEDEGLAERTGDAHKIDKFALAHLHVEALKREKALAQVVLDSQYDQISRLTSAQRAVVGVEASVLMSTIDAKYEESPYTKIPFLRAELLRSHEDNPEYARVCALLIRAASERDDYLMYIAESRPSISSQAMDRAAMLAGSDGFMTDQLLRREIAEGRVDMALADIMHDQPARAEAERRAAEAALIYDKLPMLRTLETTAPPPTRKGA